MISSQICDFIELYATITKSNFRTFPSLPRVRPCHYLQSLVFLPPDHSTNILLLTCMDLLFLDISCKWDHTVCGLLHLTPFSVMFLRWVVVAYIILPKNILLFGYTTFIHLPANGHLVCFCFFTLLPDVCMKFSFHSGGYLGVLTWVIWWISISKWQLQILQFYQQCLRVPISPFPCQNLWLDTSSFIGYMIFKYFFLVHACLFNFFNGVFWNA